MPQTIPDIAKKVPMIFRAQVDGRCQLQRIRQNVEEQDVERWASEWVEKTYPYPPEFGNDVQVKSYSINWRFVTNAGQDDGIVRPVIGARGYPYYPGSSMKGAFRRCCTNEQAQRYCGRELDNGNFAPGILRFHGGYPVDNSWQNRLVDLIHPQQDWQVKQDEKSSGAFAQISLYKPTLKFGISSSISLDASEWETIWQIWEQALSAGIGCRVSAGYGQPQTRTDNLPYQPQLKGQGMASKLLNGEGEFRPNMFKAALRGHALRLFGGMTTAEQAEALVRELFGGVQDGATVGLLNVTFQFSPDNLEIGEFGRGPYASPTYDVEGQLCFSLTQNLPEDQRKALIQLLKALTRFAMVFGGFGKSWRRADHRKFYPEYYNQEEGKPLIGCHWEWSGDGSLINNTRYGIRKLEQVPEFLEQKVRTPVKEWMRLRGVEPTLDNYASHWREAWHPNNVQFWGRVAEEAEDCQAVEWLHRPYRPAISRGDTPGTIYQSFVTGKIGQIGRLWHRMYPVVRLLKSRNDPNEIIAKPTSQYFEFLTFFPSANPDQQEQQFRNFLELEQDMFQKMWGN